MTHQFQRDVVIDGNAAVITGGASGIGRAAAQRFLAGGMNVVIGDRDADKLGETELELAAQSNPERIRSFVCDVSRDDAMVELARFAKEAFGDVSVLMNNAGAGLNPGKPWENLAAWKELLEINMWGVIRGVQAFVPDMLAHGNPGVVINTGSKQGITRPPGNPAYNLSKAGVIAYTEALAYEFRQIEDCKLSAHLMVPGFTYTGMISQFLPDKPAGAWTSEEAVAFMLESLERGDFYILCPDNDVTRQMDEKRIEWHANDMIQNRPALSRWHPDFQDAFEAFMKGGGETR